MSGTIKCHCEFPQGFGEKSGILCETNGKFLKALLCGPESFCVGPSTKEHAVNGTNSLCKNGNIKP